MKGKNRKIEQALSAAICVLFIATAFSGAIGEMVKVNEKGKIKNDVGRSCFLQPPKEWNKTFEGLDWDEEDGHSVQQTSDGRKSKDYGVLYTDPWLLDGWPVYLDTYAILASPVTFDFDNDGKNEIVIATYGPPGNPYGSGRIYVINSDGIIAPGWPFITNGPASATPAIGDLNNDGVPEIVAACWHNIYVLHFDGSTVWSKSFSFWIDNTPVLADMDKYGCLEIILTAEQGKIFAWNYDGTNVDGWPITINALYEWPLSAPAVGDLDEDSYIEIVVNTEDGKTYVFNHDGTVTDGWPIDIPSAPEWWANVNRPPCNS